MKCIEHSDRSAVSNCAKCGVGLCNECAANSAFKDENNQPYCRKCNSEIAGENDRPMNPLLKPKLINLAISGGAIVISFVCFLINQIVLVLLIWIVCSVVNLFDSDSMIRRYWAKKKKDEKVGVLGILSRFLFWGIPFVLFVYSLIGVLKVKKQIADNNKN